MRILKKGLAKNFLCFLLTITVVFSGMMFFDIQVNAETIRIGTVQGASSLNFRNGPGTEYEVLGYLHEGDSGTIIDEQESTEGTLWYKMVVDGVTGWASSKYIKVTEQTEEIDDEFELELDTQGFPDSYKAQLKELHEIYPNWKFEAQHTGLDWNDVIKAESELGVNLVSGSSPSSWKSTQEGAYDWETGEWIELDSGGWVAASTEIIQYYMDPRNFLDSTYVFQFVKQSYDEAEMTSDEIEQKIVGLEHMISGTYLDADCEGSLYTDIVMEAARTYGVCPYTLSSMMIQEQGRDGSGRSISGTVKGYEGLYNYFNIGAYATSSLTAVEKGLEYAGGGADGTATSYGRPWDTRVKSIMGGAQYYGTNYVNKGQDTMYLKKFNVQGSNPYTHQYMTNVQGAASEGSHIADAYSEEARELELIFRIPVYENMPKSACTKPTGDGSPNYMLKALSVSGYSLVPDFSMYDVEYFVTVPEEVESVKISAEACDTNATVLGVGEIALSEGENIVNITVEAQNGTVNVYTITIIRGEEGNEEQPDELGVPVLENYSVPTTLTTGDFFTVKGIVSSEEILISVTVGCDDVNGDVVIGAEANPNTMSYDIGELDDDIKFGQLQPGMYFYKITATTESGTLILLNEPFIVLAIDENVAEGSYILMPYIDNTFAIQVEDNSNEDGANVVLGTKENSEYQVLEVEYKSDGYYTLQFAGSSMLLTVEGENVQQNVASDADSQKWQILMIGDSYGLVPKNATNLCLTVQDINFVDGVNIEIAEPTITDTQRFVMEVTDFSDENDGDDDDNETENQFVDISESDYFYDAVLWAYENGITTGMDQIHFEPYSECTRSQVVTFLWRVKGEPKPQNTENPFVDVAEGEYYTDAILWAYENGITTGIDETHFEPEDIVTREQFVTFLWRTEGEPEATVGNPFVDVAEEAYYTDAILWAYENRITIGKDETHFSPFENCIRGDVVTFLYRTYN